MAAVANWRARDTSPDWINLVNSLLSPVVRFVAMSTKFAASRSGSRTYCQVKNDSKIIQLITLMSLHTYIHTYIHTYCLSGRGGVEANAWDFRTVVRGPLPATVLFP